MSEVFINSNFSLAHWAHKLRFRDDKPVVLSYCRVSTEEQADEGYSLDTQSSKNREACERRFGRGAFHIIYILVDEHGTLPFNRGGMAKGTYREGLNLAVEIFRAGIAKYLVVYKMNRITRNLRVYLELDEDVLQPNEVEIFSATEPIGNRTAAARFVTSIMGASAENAHANIISVSRDGLRSRIEQLYYTGQIPFGWRWDDSRSPRDKRYRAGTGPRWADPHKRRRNIEPDPQTAEYVKKVFEWYLSGKTPRWIAAELERLNAPTMRGNFGWPPYAVARILRKPIHAGFVRLDGKLFRGKHFDKRIIEPETYFAAVERVNKQARIGPPLKKSPNHIFGEFSKCAVCGRRLRICPRPRGPRYECSVTRSGGKHPGYSVAVDRVERRIIEFIRRFASEPKITESAAKRAAEIVNAEPIRLEQERKRVSAELEKTRAALIRWCERCNAEPANGDNSGTPPTSDVTFRIYHDKLVKDISSLESRLAELEDCEQQTLAVRARMERALSMLSRFDEIWDSMDLSEKRTFASYIIECLTFEPDGRWVNVRLKLIFHDEELLRIPVRGFGGREATGIDSLTPMELTHAYYYMNGYTDKQIAQARGVTPQAVAIHKAKILHKTGAATIAEAVDMLAGLVESRKEELLIGVRRGPSFKEFFTPLQVRTLEMLGQGLGGKQIARITSRRLNSVYSALRAIYRKLGVHDARSAVTEGRRRRIIPGSNEWSDRPTPNQLAVLKRLALGESQPQAAKHLGISLSAVKERMRCMFRKFGFKGQAQLLELARERGWLS